MFNPFRRKKKDVPDEHARRGIPSASEVPRIASTVTTRIEENSPLPPRVSPPPPPAPPPAPAPAHIPAAEPVMIDEPEQEMEPSSEAEPALPGPDVLPVHSAEADAKFAGKSPEELCEIDASMPIEEMRKRLAELFLRHNRAASSFDLELRAEAEIMLRAIVTVREKYIEAL